MDKQNFDTENWNAFEKAETGAKLPAFVGAIFNVVLKVFGAFVVFWAYLFIQSLKNLPQTDTSSTKLKYDFIWDCYMRKKKGWL